MRVPSFKRIFKNDFPAEFQVIMEKLANLLNNGIEVLYQILNKNVSIGDNILCTVSDVKVTVDASGVPTTKTTYTLDFTGTAQGTVVIAATFNPSLNDTGTTTPTGGIFLTINQSGKSIEILKLTGLPSGKSFTLRVITFG